MSLPVSHPYTCKKPYTAGKVRALFIGINYEGTSAELNGCVNDVSTMLALLEHMNFPLQEAVILVDDVRFPGCSGMPTHDNIIKAMHWLTKDAKKGDVLFMHYSGHGTQITAEMGGASDEIDGMDEAMVPVDYEESGLILDDVIFRYLCRPLPEGVRLTAILDCCHSGTLMDLPFVYTADPNAPTSYAPSTSNQCCGDILMISGCQDSQTSADAVGANFRTPAEHPGQAGGACTNALQDTILNNEGGKLTYTQVLDRMRDALSARNFTQRPQLSCSKPVDVDKIFDFRNLIHTIAVDAIPDVVIEVKPHHNGTAEGNEEEPLVFSNSAAAPSSAHSIAAALAHIPPPPAPEAAPEPDFDFEPADTAAALDCKPSEWKNYGEAQSNHGFGIEHFRHNHGHKHGRHGQGYGAGVLRFDQVGAGSWGQNRIGDRRAQGRMGRPGGRRPNHGGRFQHEAPSSHGHGGRNDDRHEVPAYDDDHRHGGRGRGGGGHMVIPQQGGGHGKKGYRRGGSMFNRIGSYTIPTDEESLREIFETFDADGDNGISRDEFVAAIVAFDEEMGVFVNPQTLKKTFERYDRNGDGKLSFPEFEIYMLQRAAQ